ncbi:hypothetical protein [Achromobacter xylosoxidans]|jgi:hypothetical protein|uniref:hypothetical protein n=3 Tax=Alcaligenes xylosoxydans xylosoxydans TaxID=85698 RepID=UPI00047E26AE|nr:hypothetical protein [Achromobacter xylosoxidans]AUZ18716.1 hypothetical protein AL509_06180 [Achromobacter xylosoxidans]AXA79265.1 hypothetical protein CE206_23880 [Achromobacter xylosoxidans]KOQ22034.1 hypothetical protein ABW34_20590 [Achromobacter xylosoxidans]KOQ23653.1 hypothetical protein ABW35_17265 [Achromobacter xylosoxidans]KOQ32031.1 hypothetical protein ABW36_16130 [Achromobacter xylosoxidans]
MKTLALALSLSLVAFSAGAQTSTSSSTTSATSGSTNAGNNQGITFNSNSNGSSTLRTAPPIGAQSFYGSFSSDSCMVSAGGGGSVVGFGMNVAFPVEDQKCSLRRNFERTMQAAASTKDPERSRRLETAAVDILCQTDDRTKAALTAQGLCTNPSLTTADHRFENPTPNVAQVAPPAQAQYAPSPAPGAQYTASAPVAQAYPVSSAQNIMANSPPLRNPRMDRQGLLDFYSPG